MGYTSMNNKIENKDSLLAKAAGFREAKIQCISHIPAEETYDLTIKNSHSFVADDVVVHNTIPKHTTWAKPLRAAYIAPEGKLILSCDYAAGELRVAADIANETAMIAAFNNDVDIHSATAAGLLGLPLGKFMEKKSSDPKWFKSKRQGAKAGNFGLLYGMGVNGYRAYAEISYGVVLSEQEASADREAFFAMYPALVAWHDRYKAFAKRHGYIRSPLGRVRNLPMINCYDGATRSKQERNAINAPVQGTLSDLTQLSLWELKKRYSFDVLKPMMMVHDDLKFYVPEDEALLWADRVCEVMSTLPLERDFGWKPKLTFSADPEIGKSLATMEELESCPKCSCRNLVSREKDGVSALRDYYTSTPHLCT